ncbi:MAG: tetratricopeptide repeat protein, partial [Planctomycetes bacterium]|nr:tetratricopeptide repeat protein [Planctomycetota bacterium]
AEKGFRKALQLHDTLADPLEPRLLWVTIDGLAIALHAQGKRPEAVKLFDRAIIAAAACDSGAKEAEAQSRYNRACAFAMMKKYHEALDSLSAAIDLDSKYATTALADEDLAEARKLKEFQDLLAARKTVALAFDAVLVKPEELPKNVRAIEGMHTNEPHPQAFYETPSAEGFAKILPPQLRTMLPKEYLESFPVPKRKEFQSFVAEGGKEGTVFVFEYETDDLALVTSFLESVLWGRDGPSEDHPEEIMAHGRVLWVISFQRGDPASEWYKERLRKKLRVPAQRVRPELDPLGAKLAEIFEQQDADAGLGFLAENAAAVERWAFGQCMLGQFAAMKDDDALAEKGFRKALALHESLEDPLDKNFVWAALDGLGVALAGQGKREEAARMFERAIAAGNNLDGPWAATRSCYNIARVLAEMQNWDEARRALAQVLSVESKFKEIARKDPAFAEARKRKEFQELLE